MNTTLYFVLQSLQTMKLLQFCSNLYDHKITIKQGTPPLRILRTTKIDNRMNVGRAVHNKGDSAKHKCFLSSIVLIKKKDDSWRLCIDCRKINATTIKNKFSISLVEVLLEKLNGATILTKLDLRSDYHLILLKEDDIHKTIRWGPLQVHRDVIQPNECTDHLLNFNDGKFQETSKG